MSNRIGFNYARLSRGIRLREMAKARQKQATGPQYFLPSQYRDRPGHFLHVGRAYAFTLLTLAQDIPEIQAMSDISELSDAAWYAAGVEFSSTLTMDWQLACLADYRELKREDEEYLAARAKEPSEWAPAVDQYLDVLNTPDEVPVATPDRDWAPVLNACGESWKEFNAAAESSVLRHAKGPLVLDFNDLVKDLPGTDVIERAIALDVRVAQAALRQLTERSRDTPDGADYLMRLAACLRHAEGELDRLSRDSEEDDDLAPSDHDDATESSILKSAMERLQVRSKFPLIIEMGSAMDVRERVPTADMLSFAHRDTSKHVKQWIYPGTH